MSHALSITRLPHASGLPLPAYQSSGAAGPPTVLVHEPCGHDLEQGFWCPSCRQTFSPTAIGSRPGPGAPPAQETT